MATSSIFGAPVPSAHRPAPREAAARDDAAPRSESAGLHLRPFAIGKLQIAPRVPAAPPTLDAQLIAILDTPLAPGETAMAGFARKEAELIAVLAKLGAIEARALHTRLARPAANDALAGKLARLTIERRSRVLGFLADARRREAIAIARR
jgi:hypothetical protein